MDERLSLETDVVTTAPLDGTLAASLERSARLAASALNASAAVIVLVGDDRRSFVGGTEAPAWVTNDRGLLMRSGVCDAVLETGDPVAVRDTRMADGRDRTELAAGAYLLVPLATEGGRARGVVAILESAPRDWTAAEIALARDHATAAATEIALRRRLARRGRVERKQRHEALHDALTGLPNRTLFTERLDRAIRRSRRRAAPFAVVLLDLDHFRVVNDSLGHAAGDALLVGVARRLEACARAEDTVARLGGDEFALLLDRVTDAADVARVAERAQAALASAIDISGYEVFTSASFGIVLSTNGTDRADYLMRSADLAMGRAKLAGRGRFAIFDPGMHADALGRLQLETELRWAVEQRGTGGDFVLHFQPIIELASGRIAGVEALVRWRHTERGLVSPATFIPTAEATGLIVPLGKWVLTQACRQLRRWHEAFPDRPPLTLAVNVSVKQVMRPDFVAMVDQCLRESEVEPSCLSLELTESVVIEELQHVAGALAAVKRLGVRIHLDDFGMGYSSLAVLDRLPLDAIKIDRAFVGGMENEQRFAQLVRTIVTLADNVGLQAIAEGVTTPAHLTRLRGLRCAYGQGFLFSPAVDADGLRALLDIDRRW